MVWLSVVPDLVERQDFTSINWFAERAAVISTELHRHRMVVTLFLQIVESPDSMGSAMHTHLLVGGLLRRAGEVLLVRQPGPDGPGTAWALPGGRVEPGELSPEALLREVWEETGSRVVGEPHLICVAQLANPTTIRRDAGELPGPGESAVVLMYEATSGGGSPHVTSDPDDEIAEIAWVDLEDAALLLAGHPFPFNREIYKRCIAAARGGIRTVAHCYFRRQPDGHDEPLVFS
ncbi:NUDIX domain-containing protein [Actinoplanes sp. NPDC051343]|uniref:NUDIX domain-containing protein n=1 Tax=Actinoplanes sp. NPDC051343 TaxID=3363906 RepID=UPI0037971B47